MQEALECWRTPDGVEHGSAAAAAKHVAKELLLAFTIQWPEIFSSALVEWLRTHPAAAGRFVRLVNAVVQEILE
jgi:hypothetical protein